MPIEQNNDLSEPARSRVSFLKVILLVGPFLGFVIALIMGVILFLKLSEISSIETENAEALKGVILLQGDLSEDVFSLTERVESLEMRLDELVSDNEELRSNINVMHPELASSRGLDEWPKKVYLTFDDGPSPNTAEILDILAQEGVKATFFTVGKEQEAYKDLYRRILDEGHTLGMHSYSHVYKEIYSSKDSFARDLDKITSYIEDITGVKPHFYRFPGGSNNKQIGGHIEEFKSVLEDRGIKYFDWNISSGDATNPALSAEEIVNNSLNGLEKHEEVIILMHDLGNKDTTVEALSTIIKELKDRDIPIVPITESTELIQYR